jgi:hypothetical protein
MTSSASPDPVGGARPAETKADLEDLRHDVEDTASLAAERSKGLAAAARQQALSYVDDRPNIRAFFDSAAEGLDDLAGSIERRSLDDFYRQAETYARRSPVTVAVGAFAAGFLLSRFVKASGSPETDHAYDDYRA